jgi:CRISPR-associated endonuclease Csn1
LLVKQQPHLMAKLKNGYADQGSNHHIAIYKRHDGSVEFEVVSLFDASGRLARREPVVRRERPDCQFVMSLAPGDAVQFDTGEKAGIWTVSGAWGNGQIVLERHTDAGHATTTRPAPSVVVGSGARKIAVDPIGRVHPARD